MSDSNIEITRGHTNSTGGISADKCAVITGWQAETIPPSFITPFEQPSTTVYTGTAAIACDCSSHFIKIINLSFYLFTSGGG